MVIIPILLFIFGLVLGSFCNVLIYRLPGDMDLTGERSMCPKCKTVLSASDLVPVFSWIVLKGRCRYCKTRISIQYPLVELASGVLILIAYYRFGITLEGLLLYIFSSACLIIALTDLRTQIIPDKVTIPLLIFFLMVSPFRESTGQLFSLNLKINPYINSLLNALLGTVACGGFLLLLAELSNGGMGGGDIKFMAAAGAYLGWYNAFMVLLLGSILGIIATMVLLRLKRMKKGELIPFGPYLAAAGIIMANASLYLRIFY